MAARLTDDGREARRTALVLGKGSLAIRVADWLHRSDDYELVTVVPVVPEPNWTDSLLDWATQNGVSHVPSGDYRDLSASGAQASYDLAISVTYDRIIHRDFIARCGRFLNIHNSPLPRYRGVSPINWALKNRESMHGVTIHELIPEVDAGPIVAQLLYSIYPDFDEVIDVYRRALDYGWALFEATMPVLDQIIGVAQNEDEATHYRRAQDELLGDRRGFTRAGTAGVRV